MPRVNEIVGSSSKEVGKDPKKKASEDDREIVQRAKDGDQDAFRALFERYHRRAYAVALGVVKNPEDANDVVQDAFVKVHKHIGNFQGTSSFYTWLYRIVMNLSIDHVRKNSKRRHIDYDDQVGRNAMDLEGDGALAPALSEANPARNALRKELSEAIADALQELPEHHRAVILLREFEGMSYEQIAEVLEVPKGTIMSRLFHARRKMQALLEPYLNGELAIGEEK